MEKNTADMTTDYLIQIIFSRENNLKVIPNLKPLPNQKLKEGCSAYPGAFASLLEVYCVCS